MTRQRKEILKEMEQLERAEMAEYEMGCGFGSREIANCFHPYWEKLRNKLASTYNMTQEELADRVFAKQYEAFKAGKIAWEPMNVGQLM